MNKMISLFLLIQQFPEPDHQFIYIQFLAAIALTFPDNSAVFSSLGLWKYFYFTLTAVDLTVDHDDSSHFLLSAFINTLKNMDLIFRMYHHWLCSLCYHWLVSSFLMIYSSLGNFFGLWLYPGKRCIGRLRLLFLLLGCASLDALVEYLLYFGII